MLPHFGLLLLQVLLQMFILDCQLFGLLNVCVECVQQVKVMVRFCYGLFGFQKDDGRDKTL
jgi:hypothetical protein